MLKIILSGIKTEEVCPVCWHPMAAVEHGVDADNWNRNVHIWHCPDCDPNDDGATSIVLYDCPDCQKAAERLKSPAIS